MNTVRTMAAVVLVAAGLGGCASTRSAGGGPADGTAPQEPRMVSQPLNSYGSLGGYRYRRLAAVAVPPG
jgi:hypothetical protein